MVDAGLNLLALDEGCLGNVGLVDLDDAAKVAKAVPSREHNPKSAVGPLNSKGHGKTLMNLPGYCAAFRGHYLQVFVIIHCTSIWLAVRLPHLETDKIGGGSDGR